MPALDSNQELNKRHRRDSLDGILMSMNDSLMRAQHGLDIPAAQTAMNNATEAAPEVDKDMADIVISSHNESKSRISDYLTRIDEEYKSKPKAEKKWWEKVNDALTKAEFGTIADIAEIQQEDMKKGQDYIDAKIAQNISGKTEDKVNEYLDPSKTFVGGAWSGFVDTVTDLDTWDSTIGAEQAMRVYSITKKLENGEALTAGEQLIVDALVDDLASDTYLAAGFGRGYKAGMVTGESLPFMVETMLNPASGFGEAITKKFGKAIFRKVAEKAGATLARAAVHGTRIATDIAGAAIMSATTSQARVAEDALNRLSGQVDFVVNEDGTLDFNGFVGGEDSAFKAYAKAYGANTIEHFSEMVGNYFKPIGEMTKESAVALANKVGAKKIANLMTEMTPNGFGAFLNDFAEQTQWHGMIGEFAEEMISGAMNALIVGDQSLKKYDENGNINANYLFDKENMIDTFLGVAILGGVMSTAKTFGYTTPETRYNRELSRARKALSGKLNGEEIEELETFAANPMGFEYANLTKFFDNSRSKETRAAIADYLKAVMEKQGYEISRSADLSGTQQGMNELRNAYQLGSNMSETDLYDVSQAEEQAKQAVIDTGVFDLIEGASEPYLPQEILEYSSYDLLGLLRTQSLTEEERTAIRNLAIVKNAQEGLNNRLRAISDAAIATNDKIANSAAKNGVITIGLYNGKKVYVKGNVNVSNGSITADFVDGGYPVEIVDSMTGEVTIDNSSEVTQVVSENVSEYNKRMADVINTYYNQRWEGFRNTKSAKSKLAEVSELVGRHVYIDTGNGIMAPVEIKEILPNGEVLIHGKKGDLGGQSDIRVDVDSFYDSMSRDSDGNLMVDKSQFRNQSSGIESARNSMYVQGE